MSFAPEPAFAHGSAARTAVLLCNLGTPDEPTPPAVRRYLAEFLERPARGRDPARWSGCRSCTASSCASGRRSRRASTPAIWTPGGLAARGLDREAGAAARRLPRPARPAGAGAARDALRPAVDRRRARRAARARAPTRVLVLPLYPQYAAATTASVGDAVAAWMQRTPRPARAALRQALPRRPRLHRRPGAPRRDALDDARPRPIGWC